MIPTLYGLPALPQEVFNHFAVQERLPFTISKNLDRPDEIMPQHITFDSREAKDLYVVEGTFSDKFLKVYTRFVQMNRRLSVAKALAEARVVNSSTDVSHYPEDEKAMLRILLTVANKIELLHMKQKGTYKYIEDIERARETEPLSHKLFWRNQTPLALGPLSQNDPFANAHPSFPKPRVDVYPPDMILDAAFFEKISKDKEFSDPFSAVAWDESGKLSAVPFHRYYRIEMEEISKLLAQAAAAIANNKNEQALNAYLMEASHAFLNSNWDAADAKWVAMNMGNSKYALRVAPDETYWDPANLKAGFEFWLARINEGAAAFAKKVMPYFQEMENHLHDLVASYIPRSVTFDCPDFIDMMVVSGDHRCDRGAVIGQKLPNGQGKPTKLVVMTNFYIDPQSIDEAKKKAAAVFVEAIAKPYQYDSWSSATGTMLHEITHGLGPRGSAKELGGANTQVMEELKAQTGCLYWIGWLQDKKLVTEEQARKLYLDAIFWCFGHIAQGMVDGEGGPKTYSQLAAIQIRHFLKTGAMKVEQGLFSIDFALLKPAVADLFKDVLTIQIQGQKDKADALRDDILEGHEGYKAIRGKEICELYEKFPKPSFNLELKGL